jgi:acetyl-CoA synthetase
MAKRGVLQPIPSLHSLVAAGEALDPETLRMWREGTGVDVRDGYGQTETGQVTANPYGVPARPGSMGRPPPGIRAFVDAGELVVDPSTVPTFFLRYLVSRRRPAGGGPGTRCARTTTATCTSRAAPTTSSSSSPLAIASGRSRWSPCWPAIRPLRTSPWSPPPDAERGSVVRAIVVLQPGRAASAELASELQDFVKQRTAPYKYPRLVEFVAELPKTTSGKIRRRELRLAGGSP